jgi:hypothetical protein
MKERSQLAVKILLTHIALPAGLVISSFLVKRGTILILPLAQCFLLLLLLAGYWEFFSARFRWVFLGISELLILLAFLLWLGSDHPELPGPILISAWALLQIYVLLQLVKVILVIYKKEAETFEIQFPFRQGNYLVTDGGNSRISRLMNYHYHSAVHRRKNTHNSMLFATDLVKINKGSGFFFPEENKDYPVFGEKLYSPVSGTVVKAVNDVPDNRPFSGNYPYNTGNTVIVKRDDYYLLLGHLRYGSVSVRQGDGIEAGDYIGDAGNSGMSERPHLHMQMMRSVTGDYWKGEGICIVYKGENLYKNRLIQL